MSFLDRFLRHPKPTPSTPNGGAATSTGQVSTVNPDVTLLSDGSVQSAEMDAYLATYTGQGTPIHAFWFSDNASLFTLNPTQYGNAAYNVANVHSPASNGILVAGRIDGVMQGYTCVLGLDGRFVASTVTAVPTSRASRESSFTIPAIIEKWKAEGFWPLVIV